MEMLHKLNCNDEFSYIMPVNPLRLLLVYNKAHGNLMAYPWMFAHDGYFEVDVLAPEGHLIECSQWIQNRISYTNEDDLMSTLLSALSSGRYDWMHCIDESSRDIILRHCDDPILLPYLPWPASSPLSRNCSNKVELYQWCRDAGLPVPASFEVNDLDRLKQCAAEIGYPCMLKGAQGSRGATVFFLEDESQCELILKDHKGIQSWLVQEFLTGLAGTTSMVCGHGEAYATCSSYKNVMLNGGLGTSVVKQFVRSEELERLAFLVAKATQYHGATGFDWMMNANGQVCIIDPHFGRGPSSMMVSHIGGVRIDQALYAVLTKGSVLPVQPMSAAYVWIFPQCLHLLLEGLIEAWRVACPLRRDVTIFWFGRREWRLFLKQSAALLGGRARVLLGRFKRSIRFSRNRLSDCDSVI
jgi:hypothetical protein